MKPQDDPPELLTVAEVAAAFRVTDETIHRWVRLGKLPFVDVFGRKRFRRGVIEEILSGRSER
jgi:excisionase family DNA binding protein